MTDQTAAAVDPNEGPGWYEVINPRGATTCIAYVHEDGSLYLPEGEASMNAEEFAFAAARGQAHRLVRADDLPAPATTVRDAARQAAGQPAAEPALRDLYARAIRDNVRLRLGPNALRLAEEGRPVMMNMSEAEAAADAVLAVRDAARQTAGQTVCACGHPKERHLTCCTECPCIGYAQTWPPQKRRIVPVCDQCSAPWATGHSCDAIPAVEQPAEAQPAEAHPPRERWRVEYQLNSDRRWHLDQPPYPDADDARDEIARKRKHGSRFPLRLVRETTTWTVEETR